MEFCETLETYLFETGQISALAKRQARLLCRSVADQSLQTEARIVLLLNCAALNKGAPRAPGKFLLHPLNSDVVKRHITTYKAEKAEEEPSWSSVMIDPAAIGKIAAILEKAIHDPKRLDPLTDEQIPEKDTQDKNAVCPLLVVDSKKERMGFSRFWRAAASMEKTVSNRLKKPSVEIPVTKASAIITQVFDADSILDKGKKFHLRQVAAAALSLRTPFMIVAGGPGTGKTSVVVQVLRVLLRAFEHLTPDRIVLCAPTGRAKARLGESIDENIGKLETKHANDKTDNRDLALKSIQRKTLHSLLGIRPDGSPKYHSANPLPHQIVVVDEASMVDLYLFAALMEAAAPDCRILLMGDMHQLPSVEAGAVLGDLTDRFIGLEGHPTLTPDTAQWIETVITNTAVDGDRKNEMSSLILSTRKLVQEAKPLADHAVILTCPYRSTRKIIELSDFVNQGNWENALKFLAENTDVVNLDAHKGIDPIKEWLKEHFPKEKLESIKALKGQDLDSANVQENPDNLKTRQALDKAFEVLGASRMLTLANDGERGRIAINTMADKKLRPQLDPGSRNRFFHGQQVILGSNHHDLDLFNGDTGIVVQTKNGGLKVIFKRGKNYSIHACDRFIDLEPAFAITVHKAQGSEFNEVLLVLPEYQSPLLTRQIIYTGITRAKDKVQILGSEEFLKHAIETREERPGGVELDPSLSVLFPELFCG